MSSTHTHTHYTTLRPERRRRLRRLVCAGLVAAPVVAGLPVGPADATLTSAAVVQCDSARNTIEVTPRVVSDYGDRDQYTATRVWLGTWTAQGWSWSSSAWSTETAAAHNVVTGVDIARLQPRTFSGTDGSYHYVYVESYMWDGSDWTGHRGEYTRSYTLFSPSVSHEPDQRIDAAFCVL